MINYTMRPTKRSVDWSRIKLLILDCDGVLTDGRIILGNNGEDLKNFSAIDGMGLSLLRRIDLPVAVVTGRTSQAVEQRCRDLKIRHVFQGVRNKLDCVEELLAKLGLEFDNVIYMGDDWNDVLCMRRAALSVAPPNAHPEIQKVADMVTENYGGQGAVRELTDYILTKKGLYQEVILEYLKSVGA